jgi:uncharacterized protein (TIGR02145 family)
MIKFRFLAQCGRVLFFSVIISLLSACEKGSNTGPSPTSDKIEVTTNEIINVGETSAVSGGTLSTKTGVTSVGICWGTLPKPTIRLNTKTSQSPSTDFRSDISGLEPGGEYYVRAYAITTGDTIYGNELKFYTVNYTNYINSDMGEVVLISSSSSLGNTLLCSGKSYAMGTSKVIRQGLVCSTNPNPTIENGTFTVNPPQTGYYYDSILGLFPGQNYYIRPYTVDQAGRTLYNSEVVQYSPVNPPIPVSDIDGNIYKTVKIGNQIWMQENLKTTKYNDGTSLALGDSNSEWTALTSGGYCYQNKDVYGNHYNLYAVANPRGLCPAGWHVPSDQDWQNLEDFLNYRSSGANSGGKMKTTGTLEDGTGLWNMPNRGGSNECGFSGFPAGGRDIVTGEYKEVGKIAFFWSSSLITNPNLPSYKGKFYMLYTTDAGLIRSGVGQFPGNGVSVRCLKN